MANNLAEKLRELADAVEQEAQAPLPPDMSVKDAVGKLRRHMKSGKLEISMSWSSFNGDCEVAYEVKQNYKTMAEDGSLANVVRKALAGYAPHDTLDRIEAALPAEMPDDVAEAIK